MYEREVGNAGGNETSEQKPVDQPQVSDSVPGDLSQDAGAVSSVGEGGQGESGIVSETNPIEKAQQQASRSVDEQARLYEQYLDEIQKMFDEARKSGCVNHMKGSEHET